MVLLIESNMLFREGIRNMLAGTPFTISAEYECITQLTHVNGTDGGNLLLLDGDDLDLEDEGTRDAFYSSIQRYTLVVLSLRRSTGQLIEMLRYGVDGILRKDFDRETLLLTLQLVQNGERVLPRELISALSETLSGCDLLGASARQISTTLPASFTEREMDVLRVLGRGLSNKEIARELHLADGTVRVYLKTILKKLGASNRTQAAIWAVKSGLA